MWTKYPRPPHLPWSPGARTHAVPAHVLEAQLRWREPPYPDEVERILDVDGEGEVRDVAGSRSDRAHAPFGAAAS